MKGFTGPEIYRMKQLYETYKNNENISVEVLYYEEYFGLT